MKRNAMITIRHDSWKRPRALACIVLLCIVCPLCGLPAPDAISSPLLLASSNLQSSPKNAKEIEYEVKAAFIYNFMKFIEWPQGSTTEQENRKSMVIGVLGDNPFGDAFVPILDKEIHGRKITLVEIPSFQSFSENGSDKANALEAYRARYQQLIDRCDVLFFCRSEKDHAQELMELTPGRGILSISDIPGFAKHEGIVGFVKDNNKIRFEINLKIAQQEQFKIRSQLLALAKKVYENK